MPVLLLFAFMEPGRKNEKVLLKTSPFSAKIKIENLRSYVILSLFLKKDNAEGFNKI